MDARLVEFEAWLRVRDLLHPSRRIMAAVSGGADSIALLRLLVELRDSAGVAKFPDLLVGHVNHGIRGAEADRDSRFVARAANRWGVQFAIEHADARARAAAAGLSPEAAARAVRYEAYQNWAYEYGLDAILLAHHRDDQAETVLLQTLRGGGLRGLSGMPPERPLSGHDVNSTLIGRPLLDWSRSQILRFLRERSVEFVEDSSNADEDVPRNRLRRRILPELEEVRPGAIRSLCRVASISRRISEDLRRLGNRAFAESLAEAGKGRRVFRVAELGVWPPSVLREVLLLALLDMAPQDDVDSDEGNSAGDPPAHRMPLRTLDTIAGWLGTAGRTHGRVQLGGGAAVELRYGKLWVFAPTSTEEVVRDQALLRQPGDVCHWCGWDLQLGVRRPRAALPGRGGGWDVPHDRVVDGWICETFDADVLLGAGSVLVRSRQAGEWFHPLGAPGRKKLKEFLRECAVPPVLRAQVPLVVADGVIVWVVGHRIAHQARVTDKTKAIVTLRARRTGGED